MTSCLYFILLQAWSTITRNMIVEFQTQHTNNYIPEDKDKERITTLILILPLNN